MFNKIVVYFYNIVYLFIKLNIINSLFINFYIIIDNSYTKLNIKLNIVLQVF